MKKTLITVFLIIGALVLVLLVWELFFANDGILHQGYNALATGVNTVFTNFTGGDPAVDGLLPIWDGGNNGQYADNDDGGTIDTMKINNDGTHHG